MSLDKMPKRLSQITSLTPPTGVHIGQTPKFPASRRLIGNPSHREDKQKKSEQSK